MPQVLSAQPLIPCLYVPAAAAAGPRVVLRSRARRNQCSDASSTTAQAMALEQPAAQPVQHQPDIQTLEPTTDAPQRPDWAYHKGPTLGVVLPFEGVKVRCTLDGCDWALGSDTPG